MPSDLHPAQRYVEALDAWLQEVDPAQRERLVDTQADALVELWHRLEDGLRDVAARRARGPLFRALVNSGHNHSEAVESLAMHVFGALAVELRDRRVRINPTHPLQEIDHFLLGVARRQLYVADRLERGGRRVRARRAPGDAVQPGDPAAAMWSLTRSPAAGVWELTNTGERLSEPVDERSQDFEDRILRALIVPRMWELVARIIRHELSAIERTIIRLRWLSDPPLTWKQIAERLGGGWTDTAVRQRGKRVLDRIEAALRQEGWDGNP